jgi:hypothetical protein
MKSEAITEARIRLRRAEAAVLDLQKQGFNFDQQEDAWWTFLLAADQIYEKLKNGARNDSRSAPWFGKVEHTRRKDPLLLYIHQARNSDQHGLAPSTRRTKMTMVAVYGCEVIYDDDGNTLEIRAVAGAPMKAQAVPPEIKLVTVHDNLHGDSFDPPTAHLGAPLWDSSPAAIATVALAHLATLIDKAESFVR